MLYRLVLILIKWLICVIYLFLISDIVLEDVLRILSVCESAEDFGHLPEEMNLEYLQEMNVVCVKI